jgi:hypothetical protein
MNLILYSGCHDIINTDRQQHDIVILYFDSKTFAPQCEVKIVVFIVLLIDANFDFIYYNVEFILIVA